MSEGRPDISTLLEHYGVRTGRKVVSCPFHPDKTPSCSVDYDSGLWNCFSCGHGGDVWSLIQEMEGVDYAGARRWAEANLGFAGGDDERGDIQVSFGTFPSRSRVSGRKGDRPSRRKYLPSWRRN